MLPCPLDLPTCWTRGSVVILSLLVGISNSMNGPRIAPNPCIDTGLHSRPECACPSDCLFRSVCPPPQSEVSLAHSWLAVTCGPAPASPAVAAAPKPLPGGGTCFLSRLEDSHLQREPPAEERLAQGCWLHSDPRSRGRGAKGSPHSGQWAGATSLSVPWVGRASVGCAGQPVPHSSAFLNPRGHWPWSPCNERPAAGLHSRVFQQVSEPQLGRTGSLREERDPPPSRAGSRPSVPLENESQKMGD